MQNKRSNTKHVPRRTKATAKLRTVAEKAELRIPKGQPTKYDPKYCEEIIEYFSQPVNEEVSKDVVTKTGDVIPVIMKKPTAFKSYAGFAIKIGVSRETLHEWCRTYPDFSDAYKRGKDYQENYLLINGLEGLTNPAMTIFTAKNVTDMKDKREIENTGSIPVTVTPIDLDERARLLKEQK